MNIVLSQEQQIFINKALEGNNILVDACIGSGKTTSIQYLCEQFPVSKSILYLTYNRLLKIDAKSKIKGKNITVTNYHGFASMLLSQAKINCGIADLIQAFIKHRPSIPHFDILIIDEYQDIDLELSNLLEIVKESNPIMQIIAVGDMEQKIYDNTALDVASFIDQFLANHICLHFTQCYRLNQTHAAMLGRIWRKPISGINESCKVNQMTVLEAIEFIASSDPSDILCLGSRTGVMADVLNMLENNYPNKFNKKTVYASISDVDGIKSVEPRVDSAIFTTYDSSKGLERKNCIVFDFSETYWNIRIEKPQQSYEILRNIFCVAASRGKENIIFVKAPNGGFLSETTLATPVYDQRQLRCVAFSELFDFKYRENIEECYSLLKIDQIQTEDQHLIDIKTKDQLIDLSPCCGIYQEASFFDKFDIDKEIEFLIKIRRLEHLYTDTVKNESIEKKILFLTSLETRQDRYYKQVSLPFIRKEEEIALHDRLSNVFKRDDNAQVYCSKTFNYQDKKIEAIVLMLLKIMLCMN